MSNKSKSTPKIDLPSQSDLRMFTHKPYSDDELSEGLEEKIDKLMKFFDLHGIDYDKFSKKAYPNNDQYMNVPGQHDTSKWLNSVKNIYDNQKKGIPYKESIRSATQGWKKMEIYDFLNWLRFYEEGTHMKYKFAQVWYENGQPGYFLHIKKDEKSEPTVQEVDNNAVNDAREKSERDEVKRHIVEKQRQKIIGRLDSAEKLLRTQDGQEFAGKELENLMEAIYNLKKKVQLVNKISTSTRLYEDMIVREANVLNRRGFTKAANTLYSLAEDPPLTATSPEDPSGAGNPGNPNGGPIQPPGTPSIQTTVNSDQNTNQPPASSLSTPDKPQPKGLAQFIENMNDGNKTEEDELNVQDEELLVTEGQVISPPLKQVVEEDIPMTDTPPPAPLNPTLLDPIIPLDKPDLSLDNVEEPQLEVTENELASNKNFDDKMDTMLAEVSISNIVSDLEELSQIVKIRDISRRLSLIDIKLNGKGIVAYFPQLGEAQGRCIENYNYISTRIDDVLSKLKGSLDSAKEIDSKPRDVSPEMDSIKEKLEQDLNKEKQRKQMKKDQENSEFNAPKKETPKIEINDLAQPINTPAPRI